MPLASPFDEVSTPLIMYGSCRNGRYAVSAGAHTCSPATMSQYRIHRIGNVGDAMLSRISGTVSMSTKGSGPGRELRLRGDHASRARRPPNTSARSLPSTALSVEPSSVMPLPLPLDSVRPDGFIAMCTGIPTWSRWVRCATRVIP